MSAALHRFSSNMQIQHAARDEKQKTDIKRQNARLPDYPFSKSAWQALLTRPARQASNPPSLRYQDANRWPYRSLRTLPNQNQFYSLLHTPAPPPRWAAKREQGSAFRLNFRNFYPIQALKSSRLIQYYANTTRNSLLEIESSQNNHAKKCVAI